MAAEKPSGFWFNIAGTLPFYFGVSLDAPKATDSQKSITDLKSYPPTTGISEPPNKELPQDSMNPHTEATKQANFVQES
jgi:hypothetical protein